ncbi:MAG: hypothetical protein ACRDIA_05820 [Actinomycetota bacterium]
MSKPIESVRVAERTQVALGDKTWSAGDVIKLDSEDIKAEAELWLRHGWVTEVKAKR